MKIIKIEGKYNVYARWNSRGRLEIFRVEKIDESMFKDILPEIRRYNADDYITMGCMTDDVSKEEKKKIYRILKRKRKALLTVDDFVHDKPEEFEGIVYLGEE